MGSAQGIENGIGSQFNYPLPFNSPKNAAEWDFTGLSALYMDPLNYGYFTSQPWLDPLYRKIKQFVMDGGTIYITADSNLFVQSLGSAAGVGLQFFTKAQVPVYYGDAGLNKILLHGALRENVGVDELTIPFMPYEDGSGGPVFKSIGSATPLAAAEIVLSDGTRMRYPAAVSFPLGKGMVYYSSFPIPANLDGVPYGLTEAQMPAVREFSSWFMSKPIANAENVRAANAAGFDNSVILARENTTVDKGKTLGLPFELTASADVTIVATIGEAVLGKVDYSTIPPNYMASRAWTASLLDSSGRVFQTRRTEGKTIAFPVNAEDNVGGTWRVRIDNAAGYLDKNIFVAMSVSGERNIDGSTVITDPSNPIAVTGVTLVPTLANLTAGGELQLFAALIPGDATSKDVTWTTSDNSIAAVSSTGKVTGVSAGTAAITVTTEDGGFTAQSLIMVKESSIPVTGILVNPDSLSLKENEQGTLTVIFSPTDATNQHVTWTTSNAAVVTVVNGTVTAHAEGTAAITATAEGGKTSVCTVTVTKESGGGEDEKQRYYETKYPGRNVIIAPDADSRVEGTDGDDVLVSGEGNDWLQGGLGSDIYVYNRDSGHDILSNADAGENDQDELHFGPGITLDDLLFTHVNDDLIISVLDEQKEEMGSIVAADWYLAEKNKLKKIVFDDGSELTTEEIEALAAVPFVGVTGVSLSQSAANLTVGGTLQLSAVIVPSDATSQDVTWSTSNGASAAVSEGGLVTAAGVGTAAITAATLDGGYTAVCVVTVESAAVSVTGVQVSPATLSLKEGETARLTAAVLPENAANKNVTWSTSNAAVAAADASGAVTAVSEGTAVITVTTEDGSHTAACTVTVTRENGEETEQEYYERKYPGREVVILLPGGSYGEADGGTVIVGGDGDDEIRISNGDNVFVYNLGGGQDVITLLDVAEGDENELHFGPGIWKEDLFFIREGNDLVIQVLDTNGDEAGSVTVEDWFLAEKNKLTKIVFHDGSEIRKSEIEFLVDNPQIVIWGTSQNDTINTNSRIGYTVITYALDGGDLVYGSRGDDVFVPGIDDDYVKDWSDSGGGGKNTFVYNYGDGNDRVDYYYYGHQPGDGIGVLRFGAGIAPEDIEIRNSGEHVIFALLDGSGSITFQRANRGDINYCLDEIRFGDGTVWRWSEIVGKKVVRGTDAAETLYASSFPGETVTVYGLGGNDIIHGSRGSDIFVPGPDDDYVKDWSDSGGGGNNVFVWNKGDGHDRVDYYYYGHQPGDGIGELRFGTGIKPEDIEVRNVGEHVVFALLDGSGSITFQRANRGDINYCLDRISFADGTVWEWGEILTRKVVRGTEGNDTLHTLSWAGDKVTVYGLGGQDALYGGPGDEKYIPGPGDDYIKDWSDSGGGGKNTFVYNRGDGSDRVDYYYQWHQPNDGIGILQFGPGISLADIEVRNSGEHVIFAMKDGSGSITFQRMNRHVYYEIDEVHFADGTVLKQRAIPRN
jgi:uncharacterized protein YjdB